MIYLALHKDLWLFKSAVPFCLQGFTYPIMILNVDIHSLVNNVFHYVKIPSFSRHMQGTHLTEKETAKSKTEIDCFQAGTKVYFKVNLNRYTPSNPVADSGEAHLVYTNPLHLFYK